MNSVTFDFGGEQVIVSGGTRGIGAAVALAFARAGAAVTILGSSRDVDASVGKLCAEADAEIKGRQCDVTDRRQVAATFATFDRIDIYVNNAGVEKYTPVDDNQEHLGLEIEKTASINFSGALLTTLAAVPHMQRGGRIVFTASIWSKIGVSQFSAYCASKHATLGMMRSLARELGPRGIRVNAVCPGWVRTTASLVSLQRIARQQGRSEADQLREITAAQCLDGLLEPADLVDTYLFLASSAARDITGQSITIDRGELCI